MKPFSINELLSWHPDDDNDSERCQKYLQLSQKNDSMQRIKTTLENQISDMLNNIIRNEFVPQVKNMLEMLEEKGLELIEPSKDYDWVNSSYAGFNIEVSSWKYFTIGIEFESRQLKNLIVGFLKKNEKNRSDITCWNRLQDIYKCKDRQNQLWIYKDYIGLRDWHNSSAIEQIANGSMVKNLRDMIEEMIKCSNIIRTEGLDF